jgi:hemerythrin-like domain-containing protein
MRATEELMAEHQAIKLVIRVLEEISTRLEAGERVPLDDLEAILDFIQGFADSCHHAKEEGLLFVEMERVGYPRDSGPVGVMLHEHTVGREHVAAMKEALLGVGQGDSAAAQRFVTHARGYGALLSQHIDKEDLILYPMADRDLSEETQRALVEGFERVEREIVGPGKHEEYHRLLDRLQATYLS